jgi:hypothetical protein
MVRKVTYLIVAMSLTSLLFAQQAPPNAPRERDLYCAGGFTMSPPSGDTYIISGEESAVRLAFNQGQLVYINRGSTQGVQVGAEFLISRPMRDPSAAQWFIWQKELMRAMGTGYADIGRIRVVHVDANTATAEVLYSCDSVQRGDVAVPFVARQAPTYKPAAKLDIFAPSSGKGMAMVVTMRDFGQVAATGKIIYVNLGTGQGARVGQYFRIFRYQGDRHSEVYSPPGQEHAVYGFGAAPAVWKWSNLPREILGEGIVISVSQNSSSVMITDSRREIYAGDYIEIE